jgi:HD-like signal output (HDOD) protein
MNAVQIASSVRQLVTFPDVYLALRTAINDPESSLLDVASILERDAGLAAGILRLANSAYFRSGAPVVSISQAASLLGMLQIHDFALGTVVMRAFPPIPAELMNIRRFWHNSMVAAGGARHLANAGEYLDSGRLFLLGLLAQVGRLAIWMTLPEDSHAMLAQVDGKLLDLSGCERARLGFDYAEVGAELLTAWDLPQELVTPIRAHVQPDLFESEPNAINAMVHVAVCIADGLDGGAAPDQIMQAIADSAWRTLDLSPPVLLEHMAEITQEAAELERQFESA